MQDDQEKRPGWSGMYRVGPIGLMVEYDPNYWSTPALALCVYTRSLELEFLCFSVDFYIIPNSWRP